jgi:hypothetical protein
MLSRTMAMMTTVNPGHDRGHGHRELHLDGPLEPGRATSFAGLEQV